MVWVTKQSNIPAMDFDVQLIQDKETLKQDLLFDNITIETVKDLITGDEIAYTANATSNNITLEVESQLLINYSCVKEDNAVLKNTVIRYAIVLYSGQTDADAMAQIMKDLRSIQSEIF